MSSELPILLESREEYEYVRNERGYEPLHDFRTFALTPELRYELLLEIFPKYSPKNTSRFYRWYWEHYPGSQDPRRCENCNTPLPQYSAVFVSHILTRGSYPFPEIAYDPRNCNLLCYRCHDQWEKERNREDTDLRIFAENQARIESIRSEFLAAYPNRL